MSYPRLLALLLAMLLPAAVVGDGGLRTQLSRLAGQHGFVIEGLNRAQGPPLPAVEGQLRDILRRWLEAYNYLIVEGQAGKIERVVITGLKPQNPKPSASPYVKTTRVGAHHQVPAVLTGPNGVPREVALLIDTGASSIVLPESLATALGYTDDNLQSAMSQTANGRLRVRSGVLNSVTVGQITAPEVQVVFVRDRRLGDAMLLGMSFLNRFRFTLDDDHDELVLMAK